ncbi:uncharacterized protein LOC134536493 [Bacillus rossius redtenbacheri]|uniref:uncharacterized protein LOC134536493 n=1 Tax=Bacillus rossius redtenbacheri TaxID=93214 RepID=UPI002FDD9CF9
MNMRLLLVLMAVCGVAHSAAVCSAPSPNLLDEMEKFVKLLPISQIEQVALNYIANDEEVQKVLAYFEGDQFAKVVNIFNSEKVIIDMYAFMCKNGIPIYDSVNKLNDVLGLPHVTPAPSREVRPSARDFRHFLDDIEKLIPIEKMKALFSQEKKNSPIFKEFVDKVSSKEFVAMVNKIRALPEVKQFESDLQKMGVDIMKLRKLFNELFGWNTILLAEDKSARIQQLPSHCRLSTEGSSDVSKMKQLVVLLAIFGLAYCETNCSAESPNLEDEIKKFKALLPLDQIKVVALKYIANDEQVQKVLQFLEGKQMAEVVSIVNSQPEMIAMYAFMCKNGIPIYHFLNNMNDLLGLPHVTPAPSREVRPSARDFRHFLDDIEKLIPVEKMKALFSQEKKNSPIFKEWVDKLSSKEFRAMVDRIIALPAVKQFRAELVSMGADVNKLEQLVRELMGWSS